MSSEVGGIARAPVWGASPFLIIIIIIIIVERKRTFGNEL